MISKVQNRVSVSGINNEKAFITTVLRIMREFHYKYEEVLSLPIPVYMAIVENINEIDRIRKENGKK